MNKFTTKQLKQLVLRASALLALLNDMPIDSEEFDTAKAPVCNVMIGGKRYQIQVGFIFDEDSFIDLNGTDEDLEVSFEQETNIVPKKPQATKLVGVIKTDDFVKQTSKLSLTLQEIMGLVIALATYSATTKDFLLFDEKQFKETINSNDADVITNILSKDIPSVLNKFNSINDDPTLKKIIEICAFEHDKLVEEVVNHF